MSKRNRATLSQINILTAVIQRVKSASVTVDGQLISKIGRGLLVLAGVGREDTEKDIDTMINRILKAKLFPAETDKQASELRWILSSANGPVNSGKEISKILTAKYFVVCLQGFFFPAPTNIYSFSIYAFWPIEERQTARFPRSCQCRHCTQAIRLLL